MEENQTKEQGSRLRRLFSKRVIAGVFITMVGLWVIGTIMVFFGKVEAPDYHASAAQTEPALHEIAIHEPEPVAVAHEDPDHAPKSTDESHIQIQEEIPSPQIIHAAPKAIHAAPATPQTIEPSGVAFVLAAMAPMNYELRERFWGWRPNDIIDVTDNINNFQLGVLEVTRRTAVGLAERLSRTGRTAAFDPNLEQAMNWFMIKPERYMLPSPEGKYAAGLAEMQKYIDRLRKNKANFYIRSDNIIPLLRDYSDLLGSCDENLVKTHEENGKRVSTFAADDYFFYSKGVASSLHTILEALAIDFEKTLEARHGLEILHHAVLSCERAKNMSPILITEGDMSGIIANHRANMAAPISHARFYLDVLIKTLST